MTPDWNGEERRKFPTSWCIEHHSDLRDIWKSIRGNGEPQDGLVFKVAHIERRQTEILDFANQIKSVFWKVLPIAIGGAVSAIGLLVWQVIKLLFEHGKL